MATAPCLALETLRQGYAADLSPVSVIEQCYDYLEQYVDPTAWIHLVPRAEALARAAALAAQGSAGLPLYGVPFAVKDNIDVAGIPTTAACPAFAYTPSESATVVQRLLDAGAILLGKTNLDQFATGLVGARSPYGVPASVFNPDFVSGGSSSGSAVTVAAGCVSFALGTDTAGSGRVPAAFNNIVGAKPTRGWLSCKGVVPACRSLDCVSVFALSASDAWDVLAVAGDGQDLADPWSRPARPRGLPKRPRIGIPRTNQREFFGDELSANAYEEAVQRLATFGDLVEIDFTPFSETAALLYDGPWVAERLEAAGNLLATQPDALDPAVRSIISKGLDYSAADCQKAATRLEALRKRAALTWEDVEVMALPTSPTHYRVDAVQANPVVLNSHLGYYTNFANLLDLCAIAVPTAFRMDKLPFGITLFAPAWTDAAIATLGERLHASFALTTGATGQPLTPSSHPQQWMARNDTIRLAVVGAHLEGMPLNHELSERAARFVRACNTAPSYKLFALPGTVPPKPGLVRVTEGGGAIAVEIWELSAAAFGDFVSRIPAPLGIGTLTMEDGEQVKGFLCETIATGGADDITHFGGWRAYMQSRATA
ncbi:allophanate hydrolase [Uliginosibacterium sp. H3]|uniref:Allophanate hydrolase n=1 Tax=Uliginosibacterium silvisoli TaxID=3114758 RepID=A0ABU6JXF2_9RHOO|nr:allophanate hydrolase [Uliginosibacterium sp. H3]